MDDERTSPERRAERHAALGDLARLRIVDRLRLGDLSVGQLRAELGIPGNLLSHHLAVLIRAGLVGETRSEGDRRRKYLHLLPIAPDSSVAPIRATRVLFVCTGNTARSPLAAALWGRVSSVPAASAGVRPGTGMSEAFLQVAAGHGVHLQRHRPRAIGAVTRAGDVMVTLCDRAFETLGGDDVVHWSVPNPSPIGTVDAYQSACFEISRRVAALAPHVLAA